MGPIIHPNEECAGISSAFVSTSPPERTTMRCSWQQLPGAPMECCVAEETAPVQSCQDNPTERLPPPHSNGSSPFFLVFCFMPVEVTIVASRSAIISPRGVLVAVTGAISVVPVVDLIRYARMAVRPPCSLVIWHLSCFASAKYQVMDASVLALVVSLMLLLKLLLL